MKKYVIIREDDVSYFTRLNMLETLYEPLFKRGLPVNFCVIPRVLADIQLAADKESQFFKRYGLRYEPFIPPDYRGQKKSYDISDNYNLTSFIRNSPIEVVQHGFSHEWDSKAEFGHTDEETLSQRLKNGREVLKAAFGKLPEFFCPPWDQISREGIYAVKRAGFLGISLSRFGRYLPYYLWPAHFWNKYVSHKEIMHWGKFLLIRHPGYFVSMFRSSSEVIEQFEKICKSCRIMVLVNHHWEYFFDWQREPNSERLQIWHAILNILLKNPEMKFVTFTTLYNSMHRGFLAK